MADPLTRVTEQPRAVLDAVARSMTVRAAEPLAADETQAAPTAALASRDRIDEAPVSPHRLFQLIQAASV